MIDSDIPIPGCQVCYDAEKNGLVSRRMAEKDHYENFHNDTNIDLDSPQGLDYSIGNLCNLKCVICHPRNSTQWLPDYIKLHPKDDVSTLKFDKHNQIQITDESLLKNIKHLHFHGGGEPLMSDAHIHLLEIIDRVKGLEDVRVFYNTNGTKTVNDNVLKLWEKCRLIELYFSIDDIGQRFNYQRTGAKWSEVKENLKWFYDNIPHNHMFNINCVWSHLNFYYLDELYCWYQTNFKTNRYGDPVNLIFQQAVGECRLDHVSPEIKETLRQKFSTYPDLLKLVNSLVANHDDHDKFWDYIKPLDHIRGQDFTSLCPEWSRLIL
jgi:hypothetical protein